MGKRKGGSENPPYLDATPSPSLTRRGPEYSVVRMFTILGGDGKEYGPASAEQLRGWIKAGRANLETKAKAVGTEEWKRLGDLAEFATPSDLPPVMTPPGAAVNTFYPTPAVSVTDTIPTQVRAEQGQRLLARIIDWIIEIICVIPGAVILGTEVIKLVMSMSQGKEPDFEQLDIPKLILGGSILAFASLGLLAVQVWMLSTRGQTIGKRIVGIKVVKADGSAAGFVNGWLMRELLITAIGIATSLIPIIGPILLRPAFHIVDWCLIFRDDQRCLHDQMAGTKVVKA